MTSVLKVFLIVALLGSVSIAPAQAKGPDPYRNFVGEWTGKILVNPENDPPDVKLTITEEKDQKGMRWDYTFGTKGHKGYSHVTKHIILSVPDERMRMSFKGYPLRTYSTTDLGSFVQGLAGAFSAVTYDASSGIQHRCTFNLQPGALSYLWEDTKDGKTYTVYSDFRFTRDAGGVAPPVGIKE